MIDPEPIDPDLLIYAMAVVPVLEGLPARADLPADAVERWAEKLALAAHYGGMAEGLRNARADSRTSDEAAKVAAAVAGLIEALVSVKPHSLNMINQRLHPHAPSVYALRPALERWHAAATATADQMARRRFVKRGARPKLMAAAVSEAARAAYEEITGKPAAIATADGKAGGAYLDFLRDLLAAVGSDASAEAQARAMKKKKKTPAI
jgi:hypothetical protein